MVLKHEKCANHDGLVSLVMTPEFLVQRSLDDPMLTIAIFAVLENNAGLKKMLVAGRNASYPMFSTYQGVVEANSSTSWLIFCSNHSVGDQTWIMCQATSMSFSVGKRKPIFFILQSSNCSILCHG